MRAVWSLRRRGDLGVGGSGIQLTKVGPMMYQNRSIRCKKLILVGTTGRIFKTRGTRWNQEITDLPPPYY